MELVEGKTLTDLIPQEGMGLGRLLELGLALTEAMSAAHRKDITHRDLKPDNIMVGDDGRLKILDFGLAKLKEGVSAPTTETAAPTKAVQTEDGRILGTVAYMSPEQAEGKPVDSRSDVFSIGILLYEMATGDRPFKGDTRMSIISSILRDTPGSVTELNRQLPRHLGRIVKRCLVKDPERRYGNSKELYNDLLELKEEIDSGEIRPASVGGDAAGWGAGAGRARGRKGRMALYGSALVLAFAAVILLILRTTGSPDATPPPRAEASFTQLTRMPGVETHPNLSPDGRMLLFVSRAAGNQDIYFRIVGGEKTLNLTEDSKEDDGWPAFSPDGSRIAFVSRRDGGGIFVMGTTGESVRRLTDTGFNPSWSPDGREILFSTIHFDDPLSRTGQGEIRAVNVETGGIRSIPHEEDAVQPVSSPNGHRIAFWGLREGGGQRDIWTIPAAGGEVVEVTNDEHTDWDPVWSPDGRFLYFCSTRSGSMNVWRVPIDERTGRVQGAPQAVTTGVTSSTFLTLAGDGKRLAYVSGEGQINLQKVGFDPAAVTIRGEPIWITRGSNILGWPDVSPDGDRLTYTSGGGQEDVFVIRTDGTGRRQLTDDPAKDRGTTWSPDGSRIAFYSDRSGSYEIWTIRPDGSALQQLTDTPGGVVMWPTWSPDGSRIAIGAEFGGKSSALIFDPRKPWGEQTPETLPPYDVEGEEFLPTSWSPDGKWLAGNTGIGPDGIAVYSVESGEYRKLVDYGGTPRWLNDSLRLVFAYHEKVFMVNVSTGEILEILSTHPDEISGIRISRDNRTLYLNRGVSEHDIWLMTLK
jgi:Tol biopolymer transport system component